MAKKKNMYSDSVKQWNPCVGCDKFFCIYCIPSFQAQMKRQKKNCMKCYNYEPHFHEKRLNQRLPKTEGDQFIWPCSSGDISCMKEEWINAILEKVREYSERTFLFQTKDPFCLTKYDFPSNVLLGITLETNRDEGYEKISKAPKPSERFIDFLNIEWERKIITIEPILDFDLEILSEWIKRINPERVYIGYNTKRSSCSLPEPSLEKTEKLIKELEKFTRVKRKHFPDKVESKGEIKPEKIKTIQVQTTLLKFIEEVKS